MTRCAKIVATLGPASQDEETIRRLILAGVNVVRLNFSHGDHAVHAGVLARVRGVAQDLEMPVCVLQDLQGPKIRTGDLPDGGVEIIPDQVLTLTTGEKAPESGQAIPVDFPDLPRCVVPGGRILLDDGNLELVVTATGEDWVEARVVIGGQLISNKGINLPGAKLNMPSLTEKDKADLAFGLEQGVDVIALSFVRSASDVHHLREYIARIAPDRVDTPVIAKLERPEAIDNLEEIVDVADGVMVARGDLGVEMPPEEVPVAQKYIIECANRHGKLVITATQMLDSMVDHPRPTRAEASDVANAILDGSDAVMLSGETAIGEYPVEAVKMMDAIVCTAESHLGEWGRWRGPELPVTKHDDTFFLTLAARQLAHDRNVAAVAVFTQSGRTAALMSKTRPGVPILAFTPNAQTYPRLGMYWGVEPYLVAHSTTIEAMLANVETVMRASGSIEPGQQVVLICGFPVDEIRPTNLALLHTVSA